MNILTTEELANHYNIKTTEARTLARFLNLGYRAYEKNGHYIFTDNDIKRLDKYREEGDSLHE